MAHKPQPFLLNLHNYVSFKGKACGWIEVWFMSLKYYLFSPTDI